MLAAESTATVIDRECAQAAAVGTMDTATVDIVSDVRRQRPKGRQFTSAEALAYQLPGRNTEGERVAWGKDTKVLNQVQLTAYPDCIGGNLASLESFVRKHLHSVVGGIHVLPFYPSSADRGFAPLTYKEVDPAFGSWDQITALAEDGDLVVDFMVNHISAQSEEFKDFVEKGDEVRLC
jgi:Alpha amylase, catalytic domain